jgi:hypothetical protein
MPIQLTCGGCKRSLKVPDSLLGKAVKCPKCAHKIKVTAEGPVNRLAAAGATGKTSLKKAAAKPASGKTNVETNGKVTARPAKKPPAKPAPAAKAPTKLPATAKDTTPPVKAPAKLTPAAKKPTPPVKNDPPPTAVTKAPAPPPRPAPTPPKPAPVPPKKPPAKGKADDEEGISSKVKWMIGGGAAVIVLCLAWYFFSGPSAGSVSGTVTIGGEPLPGARVTFVGEGDKAAAYSAIVDPQGNYTLIGPTKAGIPLGNYKVIIVLFAAKDGKTKGASDDEDKGPVNRLPETYATADRTPFTKEVRGGSNTFDLPLEGTLKK